MSFKRLGSDRLNMGIAGAVNSPTGTLFTGDITKGTVVNVDFDNESSSRATVSARRTGAIPISQPLTTDSLVWSISGTTLSVTVSTDLTGSVSFWVF